MNEWLRLGFIAGLAMSLPATSTAQLAEPETPIDSVDVQARVERAFETEERVRVFIGLRDGVSALDSASADQVLGALGAHFDLWHRYRTIPWLAGELSREGLVRLRHHPAVSAVQLDGTGTGGLADAVPATGVDMVQTVRGLTGKGITVAVLDSGSTTEHPALMGAIVDEHCFTQGSCPPGFAREGDSAEDDHNHGSNVTGIVASRGGGMVAKGYAPAAQIVSVKVLNSRNAGQISDWVAGFDWVMANLSTSKVRVINASLVSTAEYPSAAACDQSESALAAATGKLIAAGVTIASSSGNTGNTDTMTAPACNTGVIAVGATYDKDLGEQPESGGTYQQLGGGNWPACSDMTTNAQTIACFTATAGERLDLLAPGSQISSTGRGTTSSMFRGTSQASPAVAGLAALLLECNAALTPSMILDVLKKTGQPVMDPRTNLTYPLIRGMEAVEMACGAGTTGAAGTAAPGAGSGAAGTVAAGGGMGGASVTAGASGAAGASGPGSIPAAGSGVLVPPTGRGTAGIPASTSAGTSATASGVSVAGSLGTGTAAGTGGAPVAPAPASDESGCQCTAPGATGSARSGLAVWPGLGLFGLLAVAMRRRAALLRARARKRVRST